MQALFHDKIGGLRVCLDYQLVTAQVASHVKRVDRSAQILADLIFFRIESNTFSNALEAAFAPDVEHHFKAHDIRVLFHRTPLLIVSIEGPVPSRIKICRIVVPIGLGRCQTTHSSSVQSNFINDYQKYVYLNNLLTHGVLGF